MKKGDLIIGIVVLVAMAFIAIGYKIYLNNLGEERYVNIYIHNKLYQSIKLESNTEKTITVSQLIDGHDAYNIIHIYDNGVRVEEANCPNKDDVKQGFVKNPGIPIICLPHNLAVVIEGGTALSDDVAV